MTLKWYPAQDVDRNGRIGNSIYSYESSTKLIISGCEIRNHHLPYEHSLKPDYEECYIAKNHTMQFTNISYSVSAKLYCFTSSFFTRPNLAISVVLELSNRDSEHRSGPYYQHRIPVHHLTILLLLLLMILLLVVLLNHLLCKIMKQFSTKHIDWIVILKSTDTLFDIDETPHNRIDVWWTSPGSICQLWWNIPLFSNTFNIQAL